MATTIEDNFITIKCTTAESAMKLVQVLIGCGCRLYVDVKKKPSVLNSSVELLDCYLIKVFEQN